MSNEKCNEHYSLVKCVKSINDRLDLMGESIEEIKIEIVRKNAYLDGIKTGIRIIAIIFALIASIVGIKEIPDLTKYIP